MEENIRDCCRICLDVESKHVSILEDSLINLQVKCCLPISVTLNDNLPKSICETCVSQLNDFYNFQLNARCSQDWLESSIQKTSKKSPGVKPIIQPLPDSEYNSDSLLEFLNNTANIEEYLNNLGKEDIPCIVNMLDKSETCDVSIMNNHKTKLPSPKKKVISNTPMKMDIDVLDSDKAIVKELLTKEPKIQIKNVEKSLLCFGCKLKFDNIQELSQHLCTCDLAFRTCVHCNKMFDSKIKMRQHLLSHKKGGESNQVTMLGYIYSCKQCGKTFDNHFKLYKHVKQHVIKSTERICDICGHMFISDEALSKHRQQEHEKLDKVLYRCKVCYFTSKDRKKIYGHVSKHTQVREPHQNLCESCGHSFATRATLLRHSQQHSTQMYKCNICNKKFAEQKSLDKHILEHVEMIMCEKCGSNVARIDLEKHVCD